MFIKHYMYYLNIESEVCVHLYSQHIVDRGCVFNL